MARRRSVETAGGPGDFLVITVGVVLIGGFVLVAAGGAGGIGGGGVGGCADPAKRQSSINYISSAMGAFIRNHLNKAPPTTLDITARIRTSYKSAMNDLSSRVGCANTLGAQSNSGFWKNFGAFTIAIAAQLGSGYSLSAGALADMNAMKVDGNMAHYTKYAHFTSTSLATRTELEELARKMQFQYGEVYKDIRGLPSYTNDESIYNEVQNADDFTTIERSL